MDTLMEPNNLILSLPALIATVFKVILILYAGRSPRQNAETRVFLFFLFSLTLLNVAEIAIFAGRAAGGIPAVALTLYFASAIAALAICAHLFLLVATDISRRRRVTWVVSPLYGYALVLEVLLLSGPLLISGYSPVGYSFYRNAGPLYFLFEIFAVACLTATILLLVYGSARAQSPQKKTKCQLMLVAMTPTAAIAVINIVLMHYEITWFNTPLVLPLAITFFLVVATYAIHQHRLFDIQFFIPWSKVRKRKTAFYDRIRALIAEIADLVSVRDVINRLSDTLHCPVALVGGPDPIAASGSNKIVDFPVNHLRTVDNILVANEIADAMPETHALMKRHGVAAIVPFYPHSESAASWLLLGDSFSEQVYTRLDFRVVEELFDKMAELFLDKLLAIRTQLADAHLRVQTLEYRIQTLEAALASMHERVEVLSNENARLLREQPADSLIDVAQAPTKAAITLLGRDREMLRRLRESFPQIERFAGPESTSFKRQTDVDLLVCGLHSESPSAERRLLAVLKDEPRPRAALLYGSRARAFAFEHRQGLRGSIIEVLPEQITTEALVRRARALTVLGQSLVSCADPDYPLLGRSPSFERIVNEAKRVAGLADPILIQSTDLQEGLALAAYVHRLAATKGPFITVRVGAIGEDFDSAIARLRGFVVRAEGGTLVFDNLSAVSNGLWDELVTWKDDLANVRLIATCGHEGAQVGDELMRPFRPLVLEMPQLRERPTDMALLIHYYTIQFNLQSGTNRYLTQQETEELAVGSSLELDTIRAAVYSHLTSKDAAPVSVPDVDLAMQDRTLDESVADYESRLIEQTLKRCGGNKSKAARLLGLRPNTLHYKIERYGLLGKKS